MVNYFIGVMSGTSLDGIDVAIVDLQNNTHVELIASQTYAFEPTLKQGLKTLIERQLCDLREFGELDIVMGQAIASAVNNLLDANNLSPKIIKAIGSHGQTVFHHPEGRHPFSLQIGNANVIAEHTGITTVADFRQRDMVLGGQGAPLVPAFHKVLFEDQQQHRAIINIGGISNITVLPATNHGHQVVGFDTGPGNVLLDAWYEQHQKGPYDHDGLWGATGTVNKELLDLLLNDDYFKQAIPKSTGREYFNLNWLQHKLVKFQQQLKPQDVQATLTTLTAYSIAQDIRRYASHTEAVYVCGGGAHNSALMAVLQQSLSNIAVSTTEQLGLHPDWVEACAFAWLAAQTLANKTGNLPDVTGAQQATILGGVYSSNDAS
jgi:anhydro-N-acetylmuramic acid kinase